MIVKELSFTVNRAERLALETDITNLTATIEQHDREYTTITTNIAACAPVATYMRELAKRVRKEVAEHVGSPIHPRHDYSPIDGYRMLINDTLGWEQWTSSFQNDFDRRLQNNRQYRARYEQRLNEQRMRLARTKPEREITIRSSDFRADMHRHVNAKNARLHKLTHGMALEAVFDDIVLTPVLNGPLPPWIKVLDGKPPCVRIPPVKVIIDPISRQVRAKCVGSRSAADSGYIVGYSRYFVAHPHVVSRDGGLCMGDWGGPIMEALDAHDYTLAFDIIKQFLRSANDGDPAGKSWRKYIHVNAANRWYENAPPIARGPNGEGLYQYFLLDGKGGTTTFTHADPSNWPDISIRDLAPPPPVVITELPDDESTAEAEDEFDADGYDVAGYDAEGYDEEGYDADGYNRDGFNRDGYDREGYDTYGYDEDGVDADGYDRQGLCENGWDRNHIHIATGTAFDAAGYNIHGYDSDGYDRNGYDTGGYNREGIDILGYGRDGYDTVGYNREGRHRLEQVPFRTPEVAA
jgi:hypothetical protein